MKLSDFRYDLPEECIAQYPVDKRDHAALMLVNREKQSFEHTRFDKIVDCLDRGDCLVVNETKVFPARLMGTKDKTDAKVEVFLLRELENSLWEVLVKPARKVRVGNRLTIGDELVCDVIDNTVSGGRVIRFGYNGEFYDIVEKIGKSPLPPNINREPEPEDKERYQTIFARVRGAVAAPTAGLHFTNSLLKKIKKRGVEVVSILLHLGQGSYRAVLVEDLGRHKMDSEYFEVTQETVDVINRVKENKGRVVAVGASVVRALESAVTSEGWAKPASGWTDKFVYPPYEFKIVDRLITNFHLPSSTLLMLASAFAGRDFVVKAYQEAIEQNYRFYSYGDAMFIF